MGCTFMPCFLCFPEQKGQSAAIRSIGRSVPSRIRYALIDAAPMASRASAGKEESQGRAGHVDAGWIDKHTKPKVETVLSVKAQLPGDSSVRRPTAHPTGEIGNGSRYG